ncbi:centromere protein J [Aricia agestis]|uniref:centromere protein J n=1 Tax=Aricia agestis TaxID=91739 RepID=UPI001C20AAE5|nr:centromere protein J [Aricia agestis]
MDQSYSDSDVTISPSQILERLEMLRQIQVLQRSKLQKQMNFQDSSELTKSITEIVSHFSDSTSYNTFRSLLESAQETENDTEQSTQARRNSQRGSLQNVIEGVTLLNLSQESEFINDSPSSTKSSVTNNKPTNNKACTVNKVSVPTISISLDEMPILSPRKDFETLLLEKLKKEEKTASVNTKRSAQTDTSVTAVSKKPFLKRGEGMARFGLNKQDLVIQNTKALPWKKNKNTNQSYKRKSILKNNKKNNVKIKVSECKVNCDTEQILEIQEKSLMQKPKMRQSEHYHETKEQSSRVSEIEPEQNVSQKMQDPMPNTKGKTWASVLSKEQNDLLMKLKQSDYYKNFLSPAKSIYSDISCDENISKVRQEKEIAEQNLFELLENKVNHGSFSIENSFFNRFLGRTALESSGESTPFILKKCIVDNPKLMNIAPSISSELSQLNCNSETCTCDECNDTCSSVSCCCSCKTVTENENPQPKKQKVNKKSGTPKTEEKPSQKTNCQNDSVVNNEVKINMAEMNAKLQATSELLKERLKELEDEIETFRKENLNLTKMREEIELERQKIYEEKQEYEKKFNEDKILSEYYLAEEKEKIQKQKQLYERYLRDIRGRLNKKDKDEVLNLKKEVENLKEEIRIKDAKSTTALARLRNQIKIMEKEKKSFIEEIEKLKKENRRIQHSNDITRRLTNIKYLEQINRKLNSRTIGDERIEVELDPDIKYKAHAIERQSRSRMTQPQNKPIAMRPRAKSVPNLNVTSRYAKYFSQKDSISDLEKYKLGNDNDFASINEDSDNDIAEDLDDKDINTSRNSYLYDDDNNLEKIYNDRFRDNVPSNKMHSKKNLDGYSDENTSNFFLSKDNGERTEKSKRLSKSSCTGSVHTDNSPTVSNTSRSPIFLPNYSTSSGISTNNSGNVSLNDNSRNSAQNKTLHTHQSSLNQRFDVQPPKINSRMTPSPEPTTSKSSFSKTNLNPTEITKPDGSKELRFSNGNIKYVSADGRYSKFIYYNGDIKENFYNEGRIKYFYAENKTVHTTHADGLEVLEFPDGQTEKRYKDGSSEIRLPNGSIRYFDPKNEHVREEWRFPDGATMTVSANGEQRIVFPNGQIEVHTKEHKRREFPDGTVKLIYNDGTSETRYSSGRIRIKDKHGNLIMDSAPG